MQSIIGIFQKTKEVLCKYDYHIYTSKKVLHLINSELKIPHLMEVQYVDRPNQFTGTLGYRMERRLYIWDLVRDADNK